MWGAAPTGRVVRTLAVFAALVAVSTALVQTADARRGPLYVSKDGSQRSACTKARPCKSFGRAYDLARPGQVVLVRGGHYPAQRVRFDRKGSRDVIFRPATRQEVLVAGLLDIQWAQHLEVRGLRVNAWRTVGARDVTLRSLVTKWFSIQGGDGVRVFGGRAGPALNRSSSITATTRDSPHPPTSVRIDGLTVEGNRRTSAGPPVGCLDVRAADGLVIRNSRIFDCGDFGIRFPASDPAGPARNAVVENDIVSCCRASTDAISLDGDPSTRWADILIRNNSVVGSLSAGASGYLAEVGVYANIASEFIGCGQPGLVADYNVWGAGSACGAQDVVSANGFVDPQRRNFELAPGAAAIDIAAVDTASRMDIDGQARPVGPTSDAGAKESRNSALVAAFPLNEAAGLAASDASGKANAGVVSGATWTSNGRFGGALSFDGANDWMTVLDNPSLDLTSAMTLEAWVKPAVASSEWRTVLMKERAGGLAYGLYGDTSTGQPSGNVDVGTELDARAPAPLAVNTWTHLAATYDGSALKLFLNGRQVSSRSVSGSLMPSSSPLRLGGNSVWDEWFAGAIDEVRVYDRVLSASEVKKDMGSAIRVASDTSSPTAPLGLLAAEQTATSVAVSWAASVDDNGVAGYGLYRNGVLNGSTAGTTYTYTGLSCGTTYTFAVDAYDSAGNRSAQTSITAATDVCPPPDTTAPSAPSGFVSTSATQSSISVSWNAASDNVGVTGYGLYRNGTSADSTGVSPRTYTYSGLSCGTSYTLEVDATDAAGNRSAKTSLTASTSACPVLDTTAPSAPSGFVSTSATQSSISVSWNAASDNVGVTGYGLYRNGASAGSTGVSPRTYTYSGLSCGTSYTLEVDATDAAGNRSAKTSLTTSTSACPSPSLGSANLWIDLNGGSCVRQVAPAAYADSQACGSFDAASDKCQSGDLVLVKGGAYPDQTVTGSNGRTVACTIQAAASEVVNFHTLTTSGNWLTIKDMRSSTGVNEHLGVGGCAWCSTGSHVTLDNVDFPGKWAAIEISGGDSVTWKNSELGTAGNTADRLCGQDDEPARMSSATNVVIDHNVFHPFRGEENPGNCGGDVYHLETWRLWDSNDGVLFSNNHFDDSNGDDSFTISSSKGGCGGCPDNKNLRFVNNYFGDKCCGYAGADIGFGDGRACVGFVFAYNFFHSGGAGLFKNCSSESGMVYVGNMGYNPGGCPVSGTNAANLWIGTSHGNCSGNTWLSGGSDNWSSYRLSVDGMHLTSSSPSIDAAETSYCATWTARLDIDADARTATCDAGPDEFAP